MTGVVTNGTDIGERAAMLQYALSAGGWVTAAFVSAFPLTQQFGWAQGWDHYDDRLRTGVLGSAVNGRPPHHRPCTACGFPAAQRSALWGLDSPL